MVLSLVGAESQRSLLERRTQLLHAVGLLWVRRGVAGGVGCFVLFSSSRLPGLALPVAFNATLFPLLCSSSQIGVQPSPNFFLVYETCVWTHRVIEGSERYFDCFTKCLD